MSEPAGALGRRERKKLQTRRALVEAALELFNARGFDDVSVAEIAAAADVDPATFWRHFGSKEGVLFGETEEVISHFRETLARRPADEPPLTAAIAALRELWRDADEHVDVVAAQLALAERSSTIRAYMAEFETRVAAEMAQGFADRLGVDAAKDPRPAVLAGAVLAAATWERRRALKDQNVARVSAALDDVARILASVGPFFQTLA